VNVSVNGVVHAVAEATTVADLVAALTGDRAPRGVAVARAGAVVPRSAWPATVVADGDRIEILTATQGG
jgi:sulfur carrier protein